MIIFISKPADSEHKKAIASEARQKFTQKHFQMLR